MVGSSISRYKILAKLGEGGMGVVYEAEDTKLDRPVALKFLPEHLLGSDDVRKRFEREAKSSAALSHANICHVYEIDEAEGKTFIAMALIEGESLDRKIAQGPLKLDEALSIAQQVAKGLEAAHKRSIVHRDIKPENIMVGEDGHVTIMDFGLAQLTEASRLTKTDETVGTVSYMSPEQTEGSGTDHRTDIWSLGVVLYEMITGQQPFKGDYDKAVMYSILNEQPEPVTAVRTGVPMELELLVNKCLAKDADRRYQSAADMVVDFESLSDKLKSGKSAVLQSQASGPPAHPSQDIQRWQRLLRNGFIAASLLFITAVGLLVSQSLDKTSTAAEAPLSKWSFAPENLGRQYRASHVAVSPDGKHIAFVAGDSRSIWIRDLANEQAREIKGTEDAQFPFWSPDSRFVGFGTVSELKKVSVEGAAAITICQLPHRFLWGGSWSPDGESIVFASDQPLTLYEVPSGGGTPALFGATDAPNTNLPHFLPSKSAPRAIVFTSRGQMIVKNLETGEQRDLGEGSYARYSPSGHIVHHSGSGRAGLWALPFSLATLQPTGEAFSIAQEAGFPSISDDGTLVYADFGGAGDLQQLVWKDRDGNKLGEIGLPQKAINYPDLSPDERRVVFGGGGDIWIHDTDRPAGTRFTFDPAVEPMATWSPSGNEISFSSRRRGTLDLFTKSADGSGKAQITVGSTGQEDTPEWSPDGRYLIYNSGQRDTLRDLLYRERRQDGSLGEAVMFLQTEFEETAPKFSPDGRFVVYTSNESGRFEVYVRSFPEGTGKRQISARGGTQPRWSRDSREIFYIERDAVIAVRVTTTPSFSSEYPEVLFRSPGLDFGGVDPFYDVAGNGRRFVLTEPVGADKPISIHVVQNWYEEFRDREQD